MANASFPRLFAMLVAALGMASVGGGVSAQDQVAPESAPRAWLAFADIVNGKLTEWLRADDAAAVRLRAYVAGMRPDPAASSPPIVLSIWTNSQGVIESVEFPPFAHAEANADLRKLLVGKAVGAKPPRGILLPLRLAVQVDPEPQSAIEGAGPPL